MAYNYAKRVKALRFKTPIKAFKIISAERSDLLVRQPNMTCWD